MSGGDKRTRAYAVAPPRASVAGPAGAAQPSRPSATIVTAVVPPATRPRAARPRAAPSQQSTIAVPIVSRTPPSQQNTMAVPAVPTVVASRAPSRREIGLQDTMLATGAPEEIDVDLEDSAVLHSPPASALGPRSRRTSRVPTFENLTVVAPVRWRWLYVTSAAAAAMIAALIALS